MGKSDIGFQAQVRKVCEITKCSQEDAAYVLGEHDNDVDRAVMAIVDQPDANVWKENKKKSSKKEEKKHQPINTGPHRLGPRMPRPGSNTNDNRRSIISKPTSKASSGKNVLTESTATGGGVKDGEFSLKNGPLVFESSAISGNRPAVTSANNDFPPVGGTFNSSVYGNAANATTSAGGVVDSKKLSFAAVAAKSKAPLPPLPVVLQQKPPSATPQTTLTKATATTSEDGCAAKLLTGQKQIDSQDQIVDKFAETKIDDHPTATTVADSQPVDDDQKHSIGAPSSTFNSNVNREFTDQLKNDIGIGLASSHRSVSGLSATAADVIPPPPVSLGYGSVFATSQPSAQEPILDLISDSNLTPAHASSSDIGVEFLDDVSSPRATGFEFGFNKFASSHNSVISRLQQQPSATVIQQQTGSPKPDPVAVSRNSASLSYTYPSSFDYQSADVRQPAGGASGITDALFGSGKVNGTTGHQLTQETLPSQQVAPSHQPVQHQLSVVGQQPHQSATSVQQHQPHQQQQVTQQPAAAQPSSQQHSLQQQQQQMYTAAAAQFPYALPYLYSPVAGGMRDKNGMVFESSVVGGGGQTHQQPSHNKPSTGNEYGAGASVTTAGNASIYDSSSSAGDPKKLSFAAVAPPPGFSTPHFVPQQGLQSLFHGPSQSMFPLPGGYPAHIPFSLLFPGGGPQQQQSQQRQPPLQQGHYGQQQHLLQSHHQQQRHAAAALGGMDHVSFTDMAKYPNGGSNNNLQGLGNPPYHSAAFGMGNNSGSNQGQQLHRNQSLNQDNEGGGAW